MESFRELAGADARDFSFLRTSLTHRFTFETFSAVHESIAVTLQLLRKLRAGLIDRCAGGRSWHFHITGRQAIDPAEGASSGTSNAALAGSSRALGLTLVHRAPAISAAKRSLP